MYPLQGTWTSSITSRPVHLVTTLLCKVELLLDTYCNCFVRSDAYILPGASSTDAGSSITVHDNQCVSPSDGVCTSWQDLANDHFGPGVYSNTDINNVILTGTAATNAEIAHRVPLSP